MSFTQIPFIIHFVIDNYWISTLINKNSFNAVRTFWEILGAQFFLKFIINKSNKQVNSDMGIRGSNDIALVNILPRKNKYLIKIFIINKNHIFEHANSL